MFRKNLAVVCTCVGTKSSYPVLCNHARLYSIDGSGGYRQNEKTPPCSDLKPAKYL